MNKFTSPRQAAGTARVDEITGSRRLRRMRKADWSRRLVQENRLTVDDLIWPIFVIDGEQPPRGHCRHARRLPHDDRPRRQGGRARRKTRHPGASPPSRMSTCRCATRPARHILDPDNLINRTTRAIKAAVPEIGVITDVALDPFTSHGHDGILRDGIIVNDETVAQVAAAAVLQAEAGADIIAPSDMMDGRIGAIRDGLDAAGFQPRRHHVLRDQIRLGLLRPATARRSAPAGLLKGDKKTYYIDHANSDEAVREAEQDLAEGADMIMVKPGLPYLDIIRRLKDEFRHADLRLPGVGRIRDDHRRRAKRLDRRRQGDAGIAHSPSSAPAATASSPTSRRRSRRC